MARIPEGAKYRFGPLERRGLIAGWRAGQIVSVCAGVLVAIGVLHDRPSPLSVVVAVAAVVTGLLVATWPIGGRTGEEWFPTVLRWSLDRIAGSSRLRASRHLLGHTVVDCARLAPSPFAVPAPFGGLAVLEVAGRPGVPTFGIVHDRAQRTYTSVLAVRSHTFALLGRDDQDRRVAGWSGLLASLATERSAIRRVGWFASTIPDDGRGVASYVAERARLPEESPARQSYDALLQEAGAKACRHRVYLAVQIRTGRPGGLFRRQADRSEVGATLWREVRSVCRRLGEIDVDVERLLDPVDLTTLLRQAIEPEPVGGAVEHGPGHAFGAAVDARCPWPSAVEADWAHLRTDGTFHVTYWIAEWPRSEVGPDFLGPLLLGTVRRTVAVVMEPVPAEVAARKAEQARTADLADAELRRRGGFLATARRHRERELVVRREAELADGHSSVRFSGYVTVTAPNLEQLREACEATEHAAAQSRLELRRLYGDQERAFTFTLPICRGLA